MDLNTNSTSSNSHKLAAKAINGFVWLFSTSIIRQLISWTLTLLTARILFPEDFGIAALPGTIIPYLMLAASLEFGKWVVQTSDFDEKEKSSVFFLALILGIITCVIFFFLAKPISIFYRNPDLIFMFQILSVLFILNPFHVIPEAILRREMRFKTLSLVSVFVYTSQGLLTLLLAYFGFGYWALVIGVIYNKSLMALVLSILVGLPRVIVFDREVIRKAVRFGITTASASICFILYSTVDDVVIGRLFGEEMLGFYTLAFMFSQLPATKIQHVFGPLVLSYYSRLREAGDDVSKALLLTSKWAALIIIPTLILFIVVAPEAVEFFLGEKWLPMVEPLRFLSVVGIMQGVTVTISSFLEALNKPGRVLAYNAFSAILLPTLFVVLGKFIGIKGVYYAWLIGYPFIALMKLKAVNEESSITIRKFLLNLKIPFIFTIISTIALHMFWINCPKDFLPVIKLVIGVNIYCISYFALVWMFMKQELEFLYNNFLIKK